MPMIRKEVPWTRQPNTSKGIDWASPLTRGFVDAIDLAGSPRSLVLKTPAQFFGTRPKFGVPTSKGLGQDSSADFGSCYFQRDDGLYTPPEQTHVALMSIDAIAGSGYDGCFTTASGDGGAGSAQIYFGSQQQLFGPGFGIEFPQGRNNLGVLIVSYANNSVSVWWNGQLAARNFGVGISSFSTSRLILNGERTTGPYAATKGKYLLHLMWSRGLSDSEIASVSANPWQVFKPATTYFSAASVAPPAPTRAPIFLHWVAYSTATRTPPSAENIVLGRINPTTPAAAFGSMEYTEAGVLDATTLATNLSPGASYRIAWTVYDGTSYGPVTASTAAIITTATQPITGVAAIPQATNSVQAQVVALIQGAAASAAARGLTLATASLAVTAQGGSNQTRSASAGTSLSVLVTAASAATQTRNSGAGNASAAVTGAGGSVQASGSSAGVSSGSSGGAGTSAGKVGLSAASGNLPISGTAARTQGANASQGTAAAAVSGTSARVQILNSGQGMGSLQVVANSQATQAKNSAVASGMAGSNTGLGAQTRNLSAGAGSLGVTGTVARTQVTSQMAGILNLLVTGQATNVSNKNTALAAAQLYLEAVSAALQKPGASVGAGQGAAVVGLSGGASISVANLSTGVGRPLAVLTGNTLQYANWSTTLGDPGAQGTVIPSVRSYTFPAQNRVAVFA